MVKKLILAAIATLIIGDVALAVEEFDAVINDASRAFTKQKKAPGRLVFGRLTLDSKGRVVSTIFEDGVVTKATKVAMGVFDKKKKKWIAGEAIEGGLESDTFTEVGKVVQVRLTVGNDNKTITRILVKETAAPLVQADPEFDAILKRIGRPFSGRWGIGYVRVELDDKGRVLKSFGLTTATVTQKTPIAMGKYNEKEKKWEAGDPVPNGIAGDIFKDLGAKTVYIRITLRDDRRGIAQILVRQIGEKRGR
jgi:hypothetical protein